jgi:hypothetical protein
MHDRPGAIDPFGQIRARREQIAAPFVIDLGRPARFLEAGKGKLEQQVAQRCRIEHVGIKQRDRWYHTS